MGLPIDKTAILVITIACIVFSVWVLLGPGKDYALALLEQFGLFTRTPSRFEEAVMCSYYRCFGEKGCASAEIKDLLEGDCRTI